MKDKLMQAGNKVRPPAHGLITPQQLAVWLQISKRSLWRLRSEGRLPPPVKLRRSVRWRVADIEEWVARGCPGDVNDGSKTILK